MSRIDNSLFQMQILLADAKKRNAPDVIVQAFEDSVKALEAYRAHEEFMEYMKNTSVGGYMGDNHNW